MFNTWLQRTLNDKVHLELYDDFERCRAAVRAGEVNLIFANPYDASLLVRDQGFLPIAHPRGRPDESDHRGAGRQPGDLHRRLEARRAHRDLDRSGSQCRRCHSAQPADLWSRRLRVREL